jgi:antitoxin ParD1/3/4
MSVDALAAVEQDRTMSLNIPPEFERAVRERVESGEYASTDDVLKACLEALEREEAEDDEWLKREIQLGLDELDRGEGIPGEVALEMARAELRRRFGR